MFKPTNSLANKTKKPVEEEKKEFIEETKVDTRTKEEIDESYQKNLARFRQLQGEFEETVRRKAKEF